MWWLNCVPLEARVSILAKWKTKAAQLADWVNIWATSFAFGGKKKSLFSGLLLEAFVISSFPNELFWEVQISGPPREEGHVHSLLHISESFGPSCWSQSCGPVSGNMEGWQAVCLRTRERNLCSFSTLEQVAHEPRFLSGEFLPVTYQEQQQAGPQGLATNTAVLKTKLQSETGDPVSLGYLSPYCFGEKSYCVPQSKGEG